MQAQIGRLNHYHNTKRHLVGNHAGSAAPAWKVNQQMMHKKGSGSAPGSKILLSNLPYDVTEEINVSYLLDGVLRVQSIY